MHFYFSSFGVFLAIFQVLYCVFLIFHDFTVSRHIPGPTVNVSHFVRFSVFLTIFHVLPCQFFIFSFVSFLALFQVLLCDFPIFHTFQCFSPYSRSDSVTFSFFMSFSVSCHIPGHTVIVSYFPRFSVFSSKSRSHSVYLSYFTFFSVSYYIPGPTVCISHFSFFQ